MLMVLTKKILINIDYNYQKLSIKFRDKNNNKSEI